MELKTIRHWCPMFGRSHTWKTTITTERYNNTWSAFADELAMKFAYFSALCFSAMGIIHATSCIPWIPDGKWRSRSRVSFRGNSPPTCCNKRETGAHFLLFVFAFRWFGKYVPCSPPVQGRIDRYFNEAKIRPIESLNRHTNKFIFIKLHVV